MATEYHGCRGLRCIFVLAICASVTPLAAQSPSASTEYRQLMAEAVRNAAEQVLPAIVTIEPVGTSATGDSEVAEDAATSGVIVSTDGHVLTSSLVVRNPSASLLVILPDQTRKAARVIAQDHHRELVLLKIEPDDPLTPIVFPETVDTRVGETVIGVGRYGVESTPMISRGVLSATGRLDGIAIQTDARISPSLYGGPLIDLTGQVIGVLIPAIAEGGAEDITSWYDSGIAFAIPSQTIVAKLEQLQRGESIRPGVIGIVARTQDAYADGTEVATVRARSPAEAAGIQAGDTIDAVAGQPVRRHLDVKQVLGAYDAGDVVTLRLIRDQQPIEVQVTLVESIPPLEPQRLGILASLVRDEQEDQAVDEQPTTDDEAAGDEAAGDEAAGDDVADDAAAEEEVTASVVVDAVLPGSPAAASLQVGDVIQKVGSAEVNDLATLRRLLLTAQDETPLSVVVRREDREQTLHVTPASVATLSPDSLPELWQVESPPAWAIEETRVPDAPNVAAVLAPAAESERTQLGLLMLLLNPGDGTPEATLAAWQEAATAAGVVVCAVAPQDQQRWQPQEIEIVARLAALMIKQHAIEPAAVAVASPGAISGVVAGPADSMALATALTEKRTFSGLAVSPEGRAPAIRVSENDPQTPLQCLLPVAEAAAFPSWAAPLQKAGYPIIPGNDVDHRQLLIWVRLLQSI